MEKKKSERYWALLARPVIQTTVVEVQASNPAEAEKKAKQKAAKLSDLDWEWSYQPHEYGIDALTCLADSAFEREEDPKEHMRECAEDYRYMLLKANVETGEGVLLVEPWIRDSDALIAADLLKDWSIGTEHLYQKAAEKFSDWLEDTSNEMRPKPGAKVIYLGPYIEKKRAKKPEPDA